MFPFAGFYVMLPFLFDPGMVEGECSDKFFFSMFTKWGGTGPMAKPLFTLIYSLQYKGKATPVFPFHFDLLHQLPYFIDYSLSTMHYGIQDLDFKRRLYH